MKIESKSQGAELTSIKFNGEEKLFQGSKVLDENGKEYWGRQAPILFPIVGQIKDGKTIIDGKEFYMGQHGFARDMDFEEVEKTEKIHKYVLKYNEKTLEKYPYKFELEVCYEIENENILEVKYKVRNLDNKQIEFGLGAHPAFICNYSSGNYKIEFEKNEDGVKFSKLNDGLISKEKADNLIERGNVIKLNKDIFDNDALILSNIKSNKLSLMSNDDKKILEFDFTGFPYLGIWSKKGAPFVCIEPWFNTADKEDSNGIFKDKEDIIKLEPNEEFNSCFKIKFYED